MVFQPVHKEAPPGSRLPAETYEGRVNIEEGVMRISELEAKLKAFRDKHGDLEVVSEYWCADCHDTHEGPGIYIDITYDNKVQLSAIHLGMEEDS